VSFAINAAALHIANEWFYWRI